MRFLDKKQLLILTTLASISINAEENLFDFSLEDLLSTTTELKAEVGSRDGERNYLKSTVPIDVITDKQIEKTGLLSVIDVLRYFVAGFNSPQTSVADGSDHIHAYTLRSMSPDQLLILINSKRLHTSSLLHVNGTIGRGSSHADLDTIAISSIERIEILRDGAAAQYGSDAIGGVINIILKGMHKDSSLNVHSGIRKKSDGKTLQSDTFVSIPLDYDGFLNITLDAQTQDATQRAEITQTHVGIPKVHNFKTMIFSEIPQKDSDTIFYTQILGNYRDSQSSAFQRDDKTLPLLDAKITDYSFVLGVKGELENAIKWDFSNIYGENNIHYFVSNSTNYSLNPSPTSFDNGSLNSIQNTTMLDIKKDFHKLKIAGGLEFRYENYSIIAGENTSYTGTGSQGFSGYRPENEVDESRTNYAIYLDNMYNFSDSFKTDLAIRYEQYSDFGNNLNAKLALSKQVNETLMFRASSSTGFRAPSLAQSYYSQTSSFVSSTSELTTQGTFRTNHEVATTLGAKDLKPETSKHFTLGTVYQPLKNLTFSMDYFYTKVDDKIMLSPELSGFTDEQKAILKKYNVSSARFFTNEADTKTSGIDLKLNYIVSSNLNFNLWYNYSKTTLQTLNKLQNVIEQEDMSIASMIEDGQPKDSFRFLTNYKYKKIATTINISRFGSYKQMIDNKPYTFKAKWTTDLDIEYKVNKTLNIAVGGVNIFNEMPNKWDGLSGEYYGYDGIKQYSRYSPFGYSGAYYYMRGNIKF